MWSIYSIHAASQIPGPDVDAKLVDWASSFQNEEVQGAALDALAHRILNAHALERLAAGYESASPFAQRKILYAFLEPHNRETLVAQSLLKKIQSRGIRSHEEEVLKSQMGQTPPPK
jgi:hypothetical protein